MQFQLSDVLKAIGPTASIIFAAWIFLSVLQTRYDSAVDRYRDLVRIYRNGDEPAERHDSIKRQIEVYARRCTLMSGAISIGLASAVLLIVTLIGGTLDVVFPHVAAIAAISTVTTLMGLLLVITSAVFMMVDNLGTPGQLRKEVEDIGDISGPDSTRSTKLTT